MPTIKQTTKKIIDNEYINNLLEKPLIDLSDKEELVSAILSFNRSIKKHSRLDYSENFPDNYTVLDIETTGLSTSDEKIIQVSAIKVLDNIIVDKIDSFINPSCDIPASITYLTGISNDSVCKSPTIEEFAQTIIDFINTDYIIGHNINFDINFLEANDIYFDCELIDTISLAKASPINVPNFKLETLKKYFSINNNSHNSLDDCITTNELYQNIKSKNFYPENTPHVVESTNLFDGLNFVITGNFKEYTRDELKEQVISNGGVIKSTVSKQTNVLLEGVQIAKNLVDGVHSSKHLKCIELQKEGLPIERWSESEFINKIN